MHKLSFLKTDGDLHSFSKFKIIIETVNLPVQRDSEGKIIFQENILPYTQEEMKKRKARVHSIFSKRVEKTVKTLQDFMAMLSGLIAPLPRVLTVFFLSHRESSQLVSFEALTIGIQSSTVRAHFVFQE